ncbi:hypothetical protein CLW00_107115 [Mongoliibacter ruber]|uniref:Uncharacterized protein n=1 Tax=Mongoliibacter ruber TaxID=1750599 RepID=A0A2T0WK22_9BACT|nr:hypothetical protein CLW00_107115 [Mongoliibacter ruber]
MVTPISRGRLWNIACRINSFVCRLTYARFHIYDWILRFLFSTLMTNFLTVSISSGLLDAINKVKLANASLLMIEFFSLS